MNKILPFIILFTVISFSIGTLPNNIQSSRFTELHNNYRIAISPHATFMPALVWLSSLANSSNSWAVQCKWAHSGTPNVGENLYATSQRTPNITAFSADTSVIAWGSEKPYYNYTSNTCASGQICGHYTQLIWANTLNFGCAFQDCTFIQNLPWSNGGTVVVCQYSPPGNWVGQKPYTQANWAVNWQQFGVTNMKQVNMRGNDVWSINSMGAVYHLENNAWVQKIGTLNTIGSSIDMKPWGTDFSNRLYRWNGTGWQLVAGPSARSVKQVSAFNVNTASIVDYYDTAWVFSNSVWKQLLGATLNWISMGYGNDIWAIAKSGNCLRWNTGTNSWKQMPGIGLANIDVSDLQNIVATAINGTLWRWDSSKWSQLPGLGKFVTMSAGKMYSVNTNGIVYRT